MANRTLRSAIREAVATGRYSVRDRFRVNLALAFRGAEIDDLAHEQAIAAGFLPVTMAIGDEVPAEIDWPKLIEWIRDVLIPAILEIIKLFR